MSSLGSANVSRMLGWVFLRRPRTDPLLSRSTRSDSVGERFAETGWFREGLSSSEGLARLFDRPASGLTSAKASRSASRSAAERCAPAGPPLPDLGFFRFDFVTTLHHEPVPRAGAIGARAAAAAPGAKNLRLAEAANQAKWPPFSCREQWHIACSPREAMDLSRRFWTSGLILPSPLGSPSCPGVCGGSPDQHTWRFRQPLHCG